MRKKYVIALLVAVVAFIGSGAYLVSDYLISKEDRENLEEIIALSRLLQPTAEPTADGGTETAAPVVTAKPKVALAARETQAGEEAEAREASGDLAEILQALVEESPALAGVSVETIALEIVPARGDVSAAVSQTAAPEAADVGETSMFVAATAVPVSAAPTPPVVAIPEKTDMARSASAPETAVPTAMATREAPDETLREAPTETPSVRVSPAPEPGEGRLADAEPRELTTGAPSFAMKTPDPRPTARVSQSEPPRPGSSAEPILSAEAVASAAPDTASAPATVRLLINGEEASMVLDEAQMQAVTERLTAYVAEHRQAFVAREPETITFTVEPVPTPEPEPTPVPILPQYTLLSEQNTDMVGWIEIAGTKVNAPLMQTADDPEFYLENNFTKEYSRSGLPFVDARCNLAKQSNNVLIYGHHMKGGEMFAEIEQYGHRSFYTKNPTFRLDFLTETGTYQVIAAFWSKQFEDDYEGFEYYDYIDLSEQGRFNRYIAQVKKASEYGIDETAEWGDRIVTLSTCSYHTKNGRFVVVAKRIE